MAHIAELPSVTQKQLQELRAAGRVSEVAHIRRVRRTSARGGFADLSQRPWAWCVQVDVDGERHAVTSFRGARREWTSLDRLEAWLWEQEFLRWDGERST